GGGRGGGRSAWVWREERRLAVQMWSLGVRASGVSRLPTVRSRACGRAASRKVRAVPQVGQRVRTACGVERSSVGVPWVKVKEVAGTVAQVTKAAPVVR